MVMPNVRLAMAQTNPIVGDISGNLQLCFEAVELAAREGANLVVFGEMSLTGYSIEDLALDSSFLKQSESAVLELAHRLQHAGLGEIAVVVGHAARASHTPIGSWAIAQNCASVCLNGNVIGRYAKHHLPNYSVFDEYRNFIPGNDLLTFEHLGLRFSTVICEDIWQTGGPVSQIAAANTDVTLVLNGSPFEIDKTDQRLNLVGKLAKAQNTAVAYVNIVGAQDDLVFDGDSLLVDASGALIARAKQFKTDLVLIDIESKDSMIPLLATPAAKSETLWQVWNALVLGLRDYVNKNGFSSVILGLSGGIDSAVCAAIASDAIGADRVFGVAMPSRYSSDHSLADAADSASRLGLHIRTEPIDAMVTAFENQLGFEGLSAENLQARVRGVILMGLSNSEGHLVLTTGNKTELAVGYSTIYGDSVGGFAPIKDVAKTLVWELARWRNLLAESHGERLPIPERSISKPPSAELRPGQLDQDSLPEYDVLDSLLEMMIEQRCSTEEIMAAGFEPELIDRVSTLVVRSEWKRRQGAIGPKITSMSFGRERRHPITNKFKRI
jgi:NAD+ synthase (glutamine-hydrolysing)